MIGRATSWVLAGGLLLGAVLLLVASVPAFGNRTLIVRSGSMEPAISVGDLVVVRAASADASASQAARSRGYQEGDVIAFRSERSSEMVITHRVAEVREEGGQPVYVTKGDANEEVDRSLVTADRVIGRQLAVVPAVGRVFAFARTRTGYLSLIVLPALLVILGEARVIVREVRRMRSRRRAAGTQLVQEPVPHPAMQVSRAQPIMPALPVRRRAFVPVDSLVRRLAVFVIGIALFVPSTWAVYSDSEISSGNVFAAGCWTPPDVPVQLYPPDGTVAGPNSHWVADPFLDWEDSESPCGGTVQYQYQSALNEGFSPAIFTSGLLSVSEIPAPGTPDNFYYWHVRATNDGGATFSEWSDTWTLLVDRSLATANHVVISEVQIAGNGGATEDFVELYNPTGSEIDISGWQLQRRIDTDTSSSSLVLIPAGSTIPAHSFFLWASSDDDYHLDVGADVFTSGNLTANNSILLEDDSDVPVDAVAWGSGHTASIGEGDAFPTNPGAGESIERKAVSDSTAADMESGGADEDRGNGFDSDDNSLDFVLRSASEPQSAAGGDTESL